MFAHTHVHQHTHPTPPTLTHKMHPRTHTHAVIRRLLLEEGVNVTDTDQKVPHFDPATGSPHETAGASSDKHTHTYTHTNLLYVLVTCVT